VTETIKDFLVGLGWKIDEQGQDRFIKAMRGAEIQAKLLTDALEALARKAAEAVADVAQTFDRLYFSSQRTGATAASIRDMGYAVEQLGGSAEAAQASLEAMGQKLRENPGNIAYFNAVGFGLNKVTGKLEDNLDLLEKFQKMPSTTAEIYRGLAGMDERTFLARRDPRYLQFKKEAEEARKRMGFDPDQASKDANAFMTTWRRVSNDLGVVADDLFTKIMKALDGPLQHLTKFIEDHAPQIEQVVNKVADAVGRLAERFDKWFEGIDWNKVDKQFTDVKDTFFKMTDAVGGLTNAFEVFFGIWVGSKFLGALAAIRTLGLALGAAGLVGGAVGGLMNYGDASGNAGMMGILRKNHPELGGGPARPGEVEELQRLAKPPADNRNWWQRIAPKFLGGQDAPAAAGGEGQDGVLPKLTGNQPRNLRNNNPGNIVDGDFARGLPGYTGSDGTFATFDTMENGYRAANRNLDSYARKGLVTPSQIVQRWAPAGDGANDPAAYARKLQRLTGLDPDQPVGSDPASRAKMLAGMTNIEGGRSPYTPEQIAAALGGKPLGAAPAADGAAGAATSGTDYSGLNLKGRQAVAGGPAQLGLIDVARMLQRADPSVAFSALNDGAHVLGLGSGPYGAHGQGRAFDATMRDIEADKTIVRQKLAAMGFKEGAFGTGAGDYSIEPGEGGGTGPHLHFQWNGNDSASRFHDAIGAAASKKASDAFGSIPAWKGAGVGGSRSPWGSLSNPFANPQPLGGNTTGDKNVSVEQHNTFHIDGAGDPHAAAQMVGVNMGRSTADITRNLTGATN
jgi:hypothetical protein